MNHRTIAISVAGALTILSAPTLAHDPGLSTMSVKVLDGEIQVRITLTRQEAATALEVGAEAGADSAVAVFADGKQVSPTRSGTDEVDRVEVDLYATFPRAADARRLRVAVPFIARLAHGHRQYVTVSDAADAVVATDLLSAADVDVEFELSTRH